MSPHGERIIGESNSDGWVMLVGLCQSQADLIIHKNGYVTCMVTMVGGLLLGYQWLLVVTLVTYNNGTVVTLPDT